MEGSGRSHEGRKPWRAMPHPRLLIGLAALAVLSLALLLATVPDRARSAAPALAPAQGQVLHVKFREGSGVRLLDGRLTSGPGVDVAAVRLALSLVPGLTVERLFSQPEAQLQADLEGIEAVSGDDVADLNLYFRLRVPGPVQAQGLLRALAALPVVETAYVEPPPAPPPATPSFVSIQGYRKAAAIGIDAGYAAAVTGGNGQRVRIVDVEYGWNTAHEDLTRAAGSSVRIPNGTPVNPFGDDHGTAVLGELIGDDNAFGVTGLVPGAGIRLVTPYTEERGYDLANAINLARQNLGPGDVMLIEQQTYGPNNGRFVPVEWVAAYYDAIKAATAAGVIVVEAAGNGGENLDASVYGTPFPMGKPDSGAIIVGAGAAPDCTFPARGRLGFSTHGTRLNLQGWGECVVTTGYGGIIDAPANATYTAEFNGTSSASPIVAAAAASVSSTIEALAGRIPKPAEVRDILVKTGTPQMLTSGALAGKIGPLPDLARALFVAVPRAPAVTAAATAATRVDLAWSLPAGSPPGSGFRITRDGSLLTTVGNVTTFADTTVNPQTTYAYRVRAISAGGDQGMSSSTRSVTTPAASAPLFADDFETGNLSRWSLVSGVTAQSSVVFRGSFAARAKAAGKPTFAYRQLAAVQPDLYVGVRVRVASQGANPLRLIVFRTAAGAPILAVFRGAGGQLGFANDAGGGTPVTSTTKMSAGAWHRLQARAFVNGASGRIEVYLDGAKIATLDATASLGTTATGRVQIGDDFSGRTFDVAFDDVVVDRAFIAQ
jgi:serine protease